MWSLTADPDDYSSAMRYNMTFRQTVFTDGDVPANTALSSPILIDIINDGIFEGVEYFQAHIVETSDSFRVKIGQDSVNVTITDSESGILINPYFLCWTFINSNFIVWDKPPSTTLVKTHIIGMYSDGMA